LDVHPDGRGDALVAGEVAGGDRDAEPLVLWDVVGQRVELTSQAARLVDRLDAPDGREVLRVADGHRRLLEAIAVAQDGRRLEVRPFAALGVRQGGVALRIEV